VDVDIVAIRKLIGNAPRGSTLLVAPDVFDRLVVLADGEPPGGSWTIPRLGVEVRRSAELESGKAMIMTGVTLPAAPSFARKFLAKSGPHGTVEPGPEAAQDVRARPPAPPEPAPPPPPRPRTRCRVVDIEEAP
jgi:hypothetical protein